MALRKIKGKERENGMKYCSFCKPEKVCAVWREIHLPKRGNLKPRFSCDKCKYKLTDYPKPQPSPESYKTVEDNYVTEGEYQAMRLFGIN